MKLKHLTFSALALMLMSGCGDSTGVEVDDLAGLWTASSVVFTSVADPAVSVDIVTEGATVTLTLGADGSYTLVITDPVDPTETESGSYVAAGSTLTLSETGTGSPEPFTIVRSGDSMTLTDTNDDFDFNDDQAETDAILVITLSR